MVSTVCERLTHHKAASNSADNEEMMKMFSRNAQQPTKKKIPSKYGISVAGIDSMVISLAPCCQPIPGDEIVGYITKGQGVKIHRCDCPNIVNLKSRTISAQWDEDQTQKE
jgi:GTP pyrophosphokinase